MVWELPPGTELPDVWVGFIYSLNVVVLGEDPMDQFPSHHHFPTPGGAAQDVP